MANIERAKRISLKLSDKYDIVQQIDGGSDVKTIMEKYKIGQSTISRIKRDRIKILKHLTEGNIARNSVVTKIRPPAVLELDRALYGWFKQQRSLSIPISGPMLITKAKLLHKELKIPKKINFSQGWLRSFKTRYGIRQLEISGESQSADKTGADAFCTSFEAMISEHNLCPESIYNADETAVFWKALPTKTLAGIEEKNAQGMKLNKSRLTCLACSNASGKQRLKLLVIGKYRNPRPFKNCHRLPVTYKAQKNSWMTKSIFNEWFHMEFVPSVRQNFLDIGKPKGSKCVLFVDNCTAHRDEAQLVSDCGNIFVCFFPPNVTSLIQPLDQGVLRSMKCLYRNNFMMKLLMSKESPIEFQKSFSIKDAIFSLADAWEQVKQTTLTRAWKNLWPAISEYEHTGPNTETLAATLIETAETLQATSDLQEITVEDMKLWLSDVSGTESEAMLTSDVDHCTITIHEQHSTDTNETEEENTEVMSWDSAEEHISGLLKFVEQNSCFSDKDNEMLLNFKKKMFEKKMEKTRLQKIRDQFTKAMQCDNN